MTPPTSMSRGRSRFTVLLTLAVLLSWPISVGAAPILLTAISAHAAGPDAAVGLACWSQGAPLASRTLRASGFVDCHGAYRRATLLEPVWVAPSFKTSDAIFWEKPHRRVWPLAIAALPEPVALLLLGAGLLLLGLLRRRRHKPRPK